MTWRTATIALFAVLAAAFFTQSPIEALHRPWRGPHVSEDGWYYYYHLRSAIVDGDLDLENEYRDIGNWYGFGVTATGRRHNPFGIGPAVFWAPGFLVGRVIAKLTSRRDPAGLVDGMSPAEQAGALFISFLAAAGAFWIAFDVSRRYVNATAAWLGTAVAFLGGPIVWYAIYSPSMPHALEAFLGAAFLAALLPFRRRTHAEAARLGAIGGAMALVRPQLVILLVLAPIEAISTWRHEGRRPALSTLLVTMVTAAVVFAPQLLVWKWTYGRYLVVPQGSGFMRFAESLWTEPLFSSRNGLFTTTPLLWFVLPGLYVATRRSWRLGCLLIAILLAQAYVNGAVWDWWGGGAFGGRRFAATFPVWAIALALLFDRVASIERYQQLAVALTIAVVAPLLFLQWRMIAAHHDHELSWEDTVSFDQRVAAATGWQVPALSAIDPFAFPANVVFALVHGVPPGRYDRAVGPYLLDERVPTTNPLLPPKRSDGVWFAEARAAAFLGRGFQQTADGAVLAGGVGELFVPLNRPGSFGLDVRVDDERRPVSWTFNGHPVTGAPFQIAGAWVKRGINVLRVEAHGRLVIRGLTVTEGPDWPAAWATQYALPRR